MRFDSGAPLSVPVQEQVKHIREIEAMGYDGAGVADHLEYGRDAYITLALAATQTQRIQLYPSVTNPLTRHAFTLAGLANTMNELAPGRFKLAIGSGDSTAIHTGVSPARVERFREVVVSIQRLLRGETVAFGRSPEERIQGVTSPPPPVVVTGSGPRAIELAGEVGDEAHLLVGMTPAIVQAARHHLEAGAQRAQRSLDGFHVMYTAAVVVDDDVDAARERMRGIVFRWLRQGLFNVGIRALGMEVPPVEKPADIPPDLLARFCDDFLLVGSAEACVEQLQRLADEAGVEHVRCQTMGGGLEAVKLFAEKVMPNVN